MTATGTVNPVLTIIVGSYVSGVIQEISLRLQHRGQDGPGLRQDRSAPVPERRRSGHAPISAWPRRSSTRTRRTSTTRKINYERNARLAQTNAISKDTLDIARNALDQAQAQIGVDEATIQQRQAELDAAQVNLDYTNIVSPVDGTVVSRNVTVGQTVAASFQTPTLFLIATDLTQDAGRHQCQRERHRRHQGRQPRDLHRRCLPAAQLSAARSRRCGSRRRPCRTS